MSTLMAMMKNPAPVESMPKIMRDSFVELVATTLFIFIGLTAAVSTGWQRFQVIGNDVSVARVLPIAMSFGIAILALAHSIGHLSGGHMNPGVTLMMYFRGQVGVVKVLCYWVAQLVGAILGASIVLGCVEGVGDVDGVRDKAPFGLGSTTLNTELSTGNGLLLEFMGSLVFYFVIAQTALDKRGIATTPFPAIPIGLVLVAVHVCLIPFTGCGVNPARTFGPSMVVCMRDSNACDAVVGSWYWIYYVGPFAASFVAAEVSHIINNWEPDAEGDDDDDQEKEDFEPDSYDEEEPAKDA